MTDPEHSIDITPIEQAQLDQASASTEWEDFLIRNSGQALTPELEEEKQSLMSRDLEARAHLNTLLQEEEQRKKS